MNQPRTVEENMLDQLFLKGESNQRCKLTKIAENVYLHTFNCLLQTCLPPRKYLEYFNQQKSVISDQKV